jgi:hypothetical protein
MRYSVRSAMSILRKLPNLEMWLWACSCVALIGLRVYPGFVPNMGNDSFQYFSVAENALAGHIGYTSLIHFDSERSFGVMPAPMVWFPLGYSLAIALVSLLGLSVQSAAFVISALSTAACVPLLAWIGNRLGLCRMLRNATLAVFVFNAAVIEYGAAAMSEALFTCVVFSGVALVIAARLNADGSQWRWAAAGLCFGAAYLVRYAGLFFVLGFALVLIRQLFASNRALAKRYGITLFMAGVIVLAGLVRNNILVGNWRGGHQQIGSNPVFSVSRLVQTAASVKGVFVGSGFGLFAGPAFGTGWVSIARALLLVSLVAAGIGWLMWYRQRRQQGGNHGNAILKSAGIDILVLVTVYVACMFYAGLTRTRMFVPLLPLLALLIGLAVHSIITTPARPNASRTPTLLALGASLCSYVIINVFLVLKSPSPFDGSSITRIMTAPPVNGILPRSLVRSLTGPSGVIVANNGQAVGHVLVQPTVSLVGAPYSSMEWKEKAVRQVVDQFNAAAIVIYVPTASEWNNKDFVPSPFVRQLAQGDAPSWMKLVYRSNELMIYAPRLTAP